MQIENVKEFSDKTLGFSGTMTEQEHALVITFGLNTMLSMGLMKAIPNVTTIPTDSVSH